MQKLYRHIDEVLLAIALIYQRPGVSARKRDVGRRYLRWRFGPIAQRARAAAERLAVRVAVAAGVAVLVAAAATWYRRRAADRATALPVSPAPHPDGAGVPPPASVAPPGSP
jgi:hypothetical protein